MSKVFKPWTEEERRAHVRAKTLAYKARQEGRLTLREMQIKEEMRIQREEVRRAQEEGAWIITGSAPKKPEKKEKQEKKEKVKTNMFAGLNDSEDEEMEKEPETTTWTKKKFDWGADSDDE